MSKYVNERIAEIRNMAEVDIPEMIKKGTINDIPNGYIQLRISLNLTIIQAVFGCQFPKYDENNVPDYTKIKIKFNHKLATRTELAEIVKIVDNYIQNVENPYLASYLENIEDDMEIPNELIVDRTPLPTIDKISTKSIREYFLGYNGLSEKYLTGMDVINMAATAETIKNKKTRDKMLIIAALVLGIGGTGAIVSNTIKKRNNTSADVDTDNTIETYDTSINDDPDDIPTIEDTEDIPKVEYAG